MKSLTVSFFKKCFYNIFFIFLEIKLREIISPKILRNIRWKRLTAHISYYILFFNIAQTQTPAKTFKKDPTKIPIKKIRNKNTDSIIAYLENKKT